MPREKALESYPLVFKFDNVLELPRWNAGISLIGRVLLERFGDGDWSVYGLNPNGVGSVGEKPLETFRNFSLSVRRVIEDLAMESDGFEAFRIRMSGFYRQTDSEGMAQWEADRERMRRDPHALDWMKRVTGDIEFGLRVETVSRPSNGGIVPASPEPEYLLEAA